ncbi:hypothetical protein QN372_00005 [Undibacterium sp. RTI2.1]|uniref:hypothetical protein n=1 Tax=unclassified Undibacterium TaxID=2630295 RepID=UPI002AB3F6B3|nr:MULTISPECIES: hypothetical protein [unclassified Undibacterium]MDY7537522.1 hypothetical protein [Undibacterium sp. 5I1]MEB0029120.1 hypothetical protein [Undibacterium sp. RTI2.1]MEB0115428.1 hypothetical protein [Undibacterium sp. RTI2.2]MEB0232897.1 hypothetical protein [Undibacterium sp. 10I3]MEB0256257.1 hypothetical protein [Undibacterium sp. 5I1]
MKKITHEEYTDLYTDSSLTETMNLGKVVVHRIRHDKLGDVTIMMTSDAVCGIISNN